MTWTLRRLDVADVDAYRTLRLDGLQRHPEAFGSSWEEESVRPLQWFADRLDNCPVFGGFDAAGALLGVAGLLVEPGAKSRHKGFLWGMYVCPPARGTGLASALVTGVIDHAAGLVEIVRLTVVTSNASAVRLYQKMGFVEYGVEKHALKVAGRYYDESLMALILPHADRHGGPPSPAV